MQIVPISPRTSARGRLMELLDGEPQWSFLRASAGYDKVATVQAWLHAKSRRAKSALWIETGLSDRVDAAAMTALLESHVNAKIIVLDATRGNHPLDLATLKVLRSRARHIIVLARSARTLPDHLPAMVHSKIIDAETLAYLPSEVAELRSGIDAQEAQSIRDMTNGWPVLVRLVCSGNPRSPRELGQIIVAFVEEQLSHLSQVGSKVLHSTCVVSEPTLAVTMELTGLSAEEARQGWEEIVAEGLATAELANRENLFRIVPLVSETYLGHYQNENPERTRELNQRAARWFAKESQPVEAARHAIEAEDWETAAAVITEATFVLFAEHPLLARELIEKIPESVTKDHPVARILQDLLGRVGGAEAQLAPVATNHTDHWAFISSESGEEGPDHQTTNENILGISWRKAIQLRWKGEFSSALEFGRSLHSHLADTARPPSPSMRTHLPLFYLQAGITSMLAGRFADAENDLVHATRDGKAGFGRFAQRNAFADLALVAGIMGDVPRADDNLTRMRDQPKIVGFFARVAQFGELVAEASVATSRMDLATAATALAVAAESADRDELWAFYLVARARLAVAEGTAIAALTELDSLRRTRSHLAGPDSAAAFLIPLAEAELLLAIGQAARAGEVLVRAPGHPLLSGVRVLQKLQVGEPKDAIALAGSALWTDDAGPSSRALGFLARAAAELQLEFDDDAASSFGFAHALITRFEPRRLLGLVSHETLTKLTELTGRALDWESITEMLPCPLPNVSLTDRELVVLQQLTTGESVAGIARTLFVSENTVRTQVRSVYRKLGVNSRDEALAEAHRRGITH